jgi:hypothetical protein
MIKLLLLQIDLFYFDYMYNKEQVPLKKYRYWESLRKIKELMKGEFYE